MGKPQQPISIPFNRPWLAGREIEYISRALESGWISGDGAFTRKCQALLEQWLGSPRVLLTPSCTHALEMAGILLDVGPGDEVIAPSFSFVTSVNAFVLRGARPIFVDIRQDTLNIDEDLIEAAISPRAKAVAVTNYAGVGCEMDAILNTASTRGLQVVEDNAHGLFGSYRGKPLGSFGGLAALSFHETKNFTCGEGGALIINDPKHMERAEIVREKGTNRSRFFRGQVDKYTWVDVGSSYLLSDVSAAFLLAQLEARDEIQAKRRSIWERYFSGLRTWAEKNSVRLPVVPEYCGQSFHMFHMLMPSLDHRQGLIEHLLGRGIQSTFHFQPLHLSDMGRRFGGRPGDCPVTEQACDRLLRLPFHNGLTQDQQARVIEAVKDFAL